MKKEYLTISEFAEIVGRSPQAIYKQVDKKLKRFIKPNSKPILIEKSAVSLYSIDSDFQPVNQPVDNQLLNQLNDEINQYREREKHYQEQIKDLQQALHQEQVLHLESKRQIQLLTGSIDVEPKEKDNPPEGWFNRLFKRKQ